MKIVIPVSESDIHLLPLLTDAILHQGAISGAHSIWIVPTLSATNVAEEQAVRLRSVCGDVQVRTPGVDFPGGWPQAPNNHWHWVVNHLDQNGNKQPWLWLEPDAVPMVPHWATAVEEAYRIGGKPFFGFVKPCRFRDPETGKLFSPPGETMLMGVAVYPPGISFDSEIRPLFANLAKQGQFAPKEPFDWYLRWVMKNRGVARSSEIWDMWRSCNYRYEGDVLTCDPVDGEATANGGAVPGQPILIHGCKDGSLHRLVTGKKEPKPVFVPALQINSPSVPSPKVEISVGPDEAKIIDFVKATKRRTKELDIMFPEVPRAAWSQMLIKNGFTIKTGGWIVKNLEDEV